MWLWDLVHILASPGGNGAIQQSLSNYNLDCFLACVCVCVSARPQCRELVAMTSVLEE